mmetsp:Transcript_16745/g.53334  ORF Transcript_16745/g.53334 Transcript_16745/m.53334 type:complete len:476 (-) Transcript_16745:165-1592(-)
MTEPLGQCRFQPLKYCNMSEKNRSSRAQGQNADRPSVGFEKGNPCVEQALKIECAVPLAHVDKSIHRELDAVYIDLGRVKRCPMKRREYGSDSLAKLAEVKAEELTRVALRKAHRCVPIDAEPTFFPRKRSVKSLRALDEGRLVHCRPRGQNWHQHGRGTVEVRELPCIGSLGHCRIRPVEKVCQKALARVVHVERALQADVAARGRHLTRRQTTGTSALEEVDQHVCHHVVANAVGVVVIREKYLGDPTNRVHVAHEKLADVDVTQHKVLLRCHAILASALPFRLGKGAASAVEWPAPQIDHDDQWRVLERSDLAQEHEHHVVDANRAEVVVDGELPKNDVRFRRNVRVEEKGRVNGVAGPMAHIDYVDVATVAGDLAEPPAEDLVVAIGEQDVAAARGDRAAERGHGDVFASLELGQDLLDSSSSLGAVELGLVRDGGEERIVQDGIVLDRILDPKVVLGVLALVLVLVLVLV